MLPHVTVVVPPAGERLPTQLAVHGRVPLPAAVAGGDVGVEVPLEPAVLAVGTLGHHVGVLRKWRSL